jgi:hypothetical protein
MCAEREVEEFLKDFIFKLGFWGLLIRTDRANPKNIETILALGLKRIQIKEILAQLRPEDYSEGPLPDTLYQQSPMLVFGKMVKEKEVYIKIQMGLSRIPKPFVSPFISPGER